MMRWLTLFWVWMISASAMAGRVMVIPFDGVSAVDRQAELAPGFAQAIELEISRIGGMTFVQPASPVADHFGIEAACALARNSSAEHLVLGSYQTSSTEIRVSGYVIRASDAEIIATLKATSETTSLFALQDALAEQVKRALLRAQPPNTAPIASSSSAAVKSIEFTGPVRGARAESHTPPQWRSAQQKRLAKTGEASYRRSPMRHWRYTGYCWAFWPFWIP